MASRHHTSTLVGLGALLGLTALGCQSEPLIGPTGEQRLVPQPPPRPSLFQAVRLMKPRPASEASGQVQTAQAANDPANPVRQAVGTDMGGGGVVASSFRMTARPGSYAQPMPAGELSPSPTLYAAGTPPQALKLTGESPVKAGGEHLAMPRESSPVPSGEVIVGDPHGLPHGPVPVGDPHGPVPVAGPGHPHGQAVPYEGRKMALPPYRIEPPDLLLIEFLRTENVPQLLRGQFLVGPDGSVNLGIYGSVLVGGLTIREARDAVAQVLSERIKPTKEKDKAGKETGKEIPLVDEVNVDVLAYNSKVYYVITDGGGYGAAVYRLPVNGSDTVLDALAQVGGLPPVASKKKIWVARANLGHPGANQILPVDWKAVALHGETRTNYQLAPGDRVYVASDALIRTDSALGKFLNPVNRVFGSLLLGGQTVNILRGTNTGFGNTGGNTVNNNISR